MTIVTAWVRTFALSFSYAAISRFRIWSQYLQRCGASVLASRTRSDRFEYSVTIPARSSKIEPRTTPSRPLVFHWATFTDAANEAGVSRRYGGIKFEKTDLGGRQLGSLEATTAWAKAQSYFDGTATPPIEIWRAMSEASSNVVESMPITPSNSKMNQ